MSKFDLHIDPPIMNASGFLGFTPERSNTIDKSDFGAFITNPISLGKRSPAKGNRIIRFSGGVLLHTGLPNPGLREAIKKYADKWKRSNLPVILHFLVQYSDDLQIAYSILESLPGIAGLELGLPPDLDARLTLEILAHASELPIILRLPINLSEIYIRELAAEIRNTCFAVSLGPIRGSLEAPNDMITTGRLYGPGFYPITLAAVQSLVSFNIPVIAAGGVYTVQQVKTLLDAGAVGVQIDMALWSGKRISFKESY